MSEDWLTLLEDATAFNRFDLKPITALLSAPCELGTLVLREEEHSFHDRGTLETLKTFYQTHRFFDYSMTRRCFKVIDGFSSYKVPFVNCHYSRRLFCGAAKRRDHRVSYSKAQLYRSS